MRIKKILFVGLFLLWATPAPAGMVTTGAKVVAGTARVATWPVRHPKKLVWGLWHFLW